MVQNRGLLPKCTFRLNDTGLIDFGRREMVSCEDLVEEIIDITAKDLRLERANQGSGDIFREAIDQPINLR